MAKELPYFKFEPNEWENGNIQMFSHEEKGVFVDLCCMYWSRLGELPYKLAVQKICGGNATALQSLCEEELFTTEEGQIVIEFLDEQLEEFQSVSKKNSENARKRWKKSGGNATALRAKSGRNAIREDKIREDKIKEDKIVVYFPNDIVLNEKYIEYLNFRKAIKKPLKSVSIEANKKQLLKLAENNNDNAVQILEQSIANGWQGLFELKETIKKEKPSQGGIADFDYA